MTDAERSDPAFRPMLAATLERLEDAPTPCVVSPKIDGVRCVIHQGVAMSRSLKPLPNRALQLALAGLPDGLDGELAVGEPSAPDVFERTRSVVMSRDDPTPATFWAFDLADPQICAFREREEQIAEIVEEREDDAVRRLQHVWVDSLAKLNALESVATTSGFEGVMIRRPSAAYKFGRSTLKEGALLKFKRWRDAEFLVADIEQRREGGAPVEELGALVCLSGAGERFHAPLQRQSRAVRAALWARRDSLIGLSATVKFQDLTAPGVPRFPTLLRLREGAEG